MDVLKKLLQQHHPFTLALYLSAITVIIIMLFNLGNGFSEEPEKPADSGIGPYTSNVWEAEPLSLKDIEGVTRSLDEWKGKVILLNFWATWCPPCKREIPDFIEYQNHYGDAGLQIIGIGIDEPERIAEYSNTMGINYPVLIATDSQMMSSWGNEQQVLPYSVIIDQTGEVRYIHRGELDQKVFDAEIKPLI